jgi:hypothetical protein
VRPSKLPDARADFLHQISCVTRNTGLALCSAMFSALIDSRSRWFGLLVEDALGAA